jgi:hypothetical protein
MARNSFTPSSWPWRLHSPRHWLERHEAALQQRDEDLRRQTEEDVDGADIRADNPPMPRLREA